MTVLSRRRTWLADLSLFLVAVLWGVTFPTAKWILEYLPPFTYLAIRFALATLLLWPLARGGSGAAPRRAWGLALSSGLFLASGYAFQTLGLRTAGASTAAFLTSLSVLLVPVIAALWGRRTEPRVWTAVAVATLGLALLTLRGVTPPRAGEALLLLCAVSFAGQILLLEGAAADLDAVRLAAVQVGVVAIVSACFVPFERIPGPVPLGVWWAVAALAGLASALAFLVQSWAQRFTPPSHVGLLFAFEPVSAAAASVLWIDERLTAAQWLGAALILAGIVWAESGPARRLPERV